MTKEQRTISLHGTPLTYLLNNSARAKRVRISVSDAGVTLVLPVGLSIRDGEAFLLKNSDWVLQQLERRQKQQAKKSRPPLPKDVLLLRGKPVRVEFVEEPGRLARARVEERSDHLYVHIPMGKKMVVPQVLDRWLRELARTEIQETVARLSARMHVSPKTVAIRDQRTRWGSCSSSGTLSFNWRLIMVPPAVMEYVAVHELAHMTVPNHSADFWHLVAQYYPAYKEARSWLRKNAPLLHPLILREI
jgi:predicted metal-dependent hydrolase